MLDASVESGAAINRGRRSGMKLRQDNGRPALLFVAIESLAVCAMASALPGDLNNDGEVSLSDVASFVGCIGGPNGESIDSLCVPGAFNSDELIDLLDVAAFQQRFGFGVGPPRIDHFWPTPGEWIVDDVGLTHIEVGFSEPVIVPREAIIVWRVSRGIGDNRVEEFAHSYDADSDVLTITFDPPIRDDRMTLVLDYLIEDLSGRPLDGEIYNPLNASLPSGDGHNGGQAVFRIHVLQGDANRDGVVDETDTAMVDDSLGLCDGEAAFVSDADLNGDGCVDAADTMIVGDAVGRELPEMDGTQPTVIGVYADGDFGSFDTLTIEFSERIEGYKVNERSCFLLDANDNVIVPDFYGTGLFGYDMGFYFIPRYSHCNLFRINVSNAVMDLSGELSIPLSPCICLEDCP